MDLSELEGELANCQACPLRQDAIAPVGWYGNPESPIVFVGEGPGQVEDDYGCPLIGPSGQLLDKALWAAKMTRDRVLTTNVIKCRPKNNRTPDIAEADFCAKQWLQRELEIIKPKVIVAWAAWRCIVWDDRICALRTTAVCGSARSRALIALLPTIRRICCVSMASSW